MAQPLTSKDLQVLSAMLLTEYCGNKKGAMHAKCLKSEMLKKLSCTFAEKHKARFEAIKKSLESCQ